MALTACFNQFFFFFAFPRAGLALVQMVRAEESGVAELRRELAVESGRSSFFVGKNSCLVLGENPRMIPAGIAGPGGGCYLGRDKDKVVLGCPRQKHGI